MSNKTLGIIVVIIILVAIGAVGLIRIMNKSNEPMTNTTEDQQQNQNQVAGENNQTPPAASARTYTTAVAIPGCTRNFDSAKLENDKIDIAGKFAVMDVKGFGQIKVELYDKDAPKTVENFLRLANSGYYDCVTFHRVAKGFVVQAGDPSGTGSGGDSAFGGEFADELNPNTPSYKAGYVKGVLAMANRGANTNSSQFFIMLGDVPLPHNYTIFGKVVAGLEVVDKIGAVEIVPQLGPTDGAPKEKVVIQKVTVTTK